MTHPWWTAPSPAGPFWLELETKETQTSMTSVVKLFTRNPVITADLIKAALAAAVAFGLPLNGLQTSAVLGLAVTGLALAVGVRALVSPVATVAETVAGATAGALDTAATAANVAATQVAMLLTDKTAGPAGVVPDAAADVIGKVVSGVTDLLTAGKAGEAGKVAMGMVILALAAAVLLLGFVTCFQK